MTDRERAESILSELATVRGKMLRAASKIAKEGDLVVTGSKRLEALEGLASAVLAAMQHSTMTRDYADVRDRIGYLGKRYLVDRHEGDVVRTAAFQVRCNGGIRGEKE